MQKIFFFIQNKFHSVTHVSTLIFQGIFKNIVFRSVASVKRKVWTILDFLHWILYRPNYSLNKKNFLQKIL